MLKEFIPYGNPYSENKPDLLSLSMARETLVACGKNKDFEVLELRFLKETEGEIKEIIVVDCLNDSVPSRNSVGIKKRERIALVFSDNNDSEPQVRALRKDFPSTPMHMFSVPQSEPAHLCLYNTPWSDVERTWTPQLFLKRILWWFSGTADGTLHQDDQPVEQMFYNSPYKIVLPPDFFDKFRDDRYSMILQAVYSSEGTFRVVCGNFVPKNETGNHKIPKTSFLFLNMPPVVHARPEPYARTLGETHDQLKARGIDLLGQLNDSIKVLAKPNGISRSAGESCLIVLCIPIKRSEEKVPERFDIRALITNIDLASLGEKTGVLSLHDKKYYAVHNIGGKGDVTPLEWRDLPVDPIEIRNKIDRSYAQKASDIPAETAAFNGVIAGVGALGSVLVDLWSREAWGHWTLIDHDTVEPHNMVRHIAKDFCIGMPKVDAVKMIVEKNYQDGYYRVETIADTADNFSNPDVINTLIKASLIVDATTTLGFPREISQRDDVPRSVSIFLSPSGQSSVLLFESEDRKIRLDSLEAQYYRAVINSKWGLDHLTGQIGSVRVGTGCRDVSAVISNELVLMHAANIARQVRILRDQERPHIRVWISDFEMGSMDVINVDVHKTILTKCSGWSVAWDEGIRNKLNSLREKELPNETGGIILGFIDHKIKKIFIVDVLAAPPDSQGDTNGFTRGIEGLKEIIDGVTQRTAHIVDYIGEWHSHPNTIPARPSQQDMFLITELAEALSKDGLPALMIIVGEDDVHFSLKENHE